ncbi:murein hydrolase activator EnvC family protein [Salinivirga cyanobacteriivorans]
MALKKIFLLIFIFCFSISLFSQNRDKLEEQRRSLIQEIKYTNQLLEKNKKRKNLTLNQLAIVKQKIDLREKLIYQLENDLNGISQQILENQIMIESLREDLSEIKAEYAQLVYYAYKNRNSYDRLMFIFSSEDFNQAYRRLKYLRHYNQYRRKQAQSIKATQTVIQEKISELKSARNQKSTLLDQRQRETKILGEERSNQKSAVQKLSQREKKLKEELKKKQALAEQLNKQIQELIAEEIARRKRTNNFELTPEQQLIDDNFASNKSRLPWPIKRGVVTEKFGEHPHPVLDGIKVRNDGVDISTNPGEVVRSVFKGEVRKIFKIPGLNKTCIIRHGKYMTVYSNLDEIFVKVGEKVDSKQTIGIVHTNKEEGIGTFKFQVWREFSKLDPEKWLAGK